MLLALLSDRWAAQPGDDAEGARPGVDAGPKGPEGGVALEGWDPPGWAAGAPRRGSEEQTAAVRVLLAYANGGVLDAQALQASGEGGERGEGRPGPAHAAVLAAAGYLGFARLLPGGAADPAAGVRLLLCHLCSAAPPRGRARC
jgi:hypothetical protein